MNKPTAIVWNVFSKANSFDKDIYHLISMVLKKFDFLQSISFFLDENTFQKRRVSSPAPVTIVCPEGFIAKNRTRLV